MKIQVATRLLLLTPVSTRIGFREDKLCGSDRREETSNRISIVDAFFRMTAKIASILN
ncbi:MAG: hypothetical protein OXJ52_06410 [Oligoflexia bacterium]|nr:hypothetical protein [Oligoflexia bacterium]